MNQIIKLVPVLFVLTIPALCFGKELCFDSSYRFIKELGSILPERSFAPIRQSDGNSTKTIGLRYLGNSDILNAAGVKKHAQILEICDISLREVFNQKKEPKYRCCTIESNQLKVKVSEGLLQTYTVELPFE